MRATSTRGMLTENTTRHDTCRSTLHRSTGPSSTEACPAPPTARCPVPGRCPRKAPFDIARLAGTMNAPPTPWKILAAISAPTDGAEPHNTDAMTVTISPNPSNCRFPKWSAKLPDNNKRAATASKYPVSVHWTALTLASRSRPIAGTASLTTLASKNASPRRARSLRSARDHRDYATGEVADLLPPPRSQRLERRRATWRVRRPSRLVPSRAPYQRSPPHIKGSRSVGFLAPVNCTGSRTLRRASGYRRGPRGSEYGDQR